MYEFERITESDLGPLLGDIAQMAADVAGGVIRSLRLRETFPIWQIGGAVAERPEESATFTGAWHHQLWIDESPALYAVIRRVDSLKLAVVDVGQGPLVRNIQRALGVVEGETDVRLLKLPAYGLQFLWSETGARRLVLVEDAGKETLTPMTDQEFSAFVRSRSLIVGVRVL